VGCGVGIGVGAGVGMGVGIGVGAGVGCGVGIGVDAFNLFETAAMKSSSSSEGEVPPRFVWNKDGFSLVTGSESVP